MNNIFKIIKDYQKTVQIGVLALQKEYSTKTLLNDWNNGLIPKSGKLKSGMEFEFHGVGCILTINNIDVDFDFGPNNRFDGFDLWRISNFIDEFEDKHPLYKKNNNQLKVDFLGLEKNKIIYKPDWFPGSSLYYFVQK